VFRRTALWLLLPVSLVQGLRLRRQALRLPGAPGARTGTYGSGDPFRLLAIGDSIVDGVGIPRFENTLPAQFARELSEQQGLRVSWRAEGATGHTVNDVRQRLESLQSDEPFDLVVVSVGVNDVTGLTRRARWRSGLVSLIRILRRRWPGVRIIFLGLPPMDQFPLPPQPLRSTLGMRAGALDRIVVSVASGYPGVLHVPTRINPAEHTFCEDGFHPSAESCTLWAREITDVARRNFK
jgi:lysophospholipase L1-like esterase